MPAGQGHDNGVGCCRRVQWVETHRTIPTVSHDRCGLESLGWQRRGSAVVSDKPQRVGVGRQPQRHHPPAQCGLYGGAEPVRVGARDCDGTDAVKTQDETAGVDVPIQQVFVPSINDLMLKGQAEAVSVKDNRRCPARKGTRNSSLDLPPEGQHDVRAGSTNSANAFVEFILPRRRPRSTTKEYYRSGVSIVVDPSSAILPNFKSEVSFFYREKLGKTQFCSVRRIYATTEQNCEKKKNSL